MPKAKSEKKTSNTYEAMFLLGAGHATDLDNALKLVRGIIERHEGKVIVLKKWDERKLAYEIRGEKRGLYVIAFFTAPSPAISAIVRDVELSDEILRVIVTKADHLNAQEMAAVEPQPIIPREERNPWDRPQWEDRPPSPRRDRPPRFSRGEESTEAAAKE
ncbi:MAG: 30S ribosomal protein S6 [Tepidisphaeraceae bacterium]|jgi:ribosomal protein S6